MKKRCCFFIAFFLSLCSVSAQETGFVPATNDTTAIPDSTFMLPAIREQTDTVRRETTDTAWLNFRLKKYMPVVWQLLPLHPYFGFSADARSRKADAVFRTHHSKDGLFYLLAFLFLVFALLRNTFPKYFSDLFRLFFRTTLKQRQTEEQLIQTPLPSLLLNGFFVLSAGLYISFILQHYQLNPTDHFWLQSLYSMMLLSVIYLVKFIGLQTAGWLFQSAEAARSYIFIVFIINKMIGILLLPFLCILAFASGNLYNSGLVLSYFLIGGLFLYRLFLTWSALRSQISINLFHFLLYLAAFEVVPLLLLYKVLILYFNNSA